MTQKMVARGYGVHHVMKSLSVDKIDNCPRGVALVGFCSDEGVARNKGRIGARHAPDIIRRSLANMAWHLKSPML